MGPTNYRKTPQDTARHRKTPTRHRKTLQDTARHLQDTARDLKKDAWKVIIDIQGCGGGVGGGGGGGGGVVTKFFGRTFLLHFCTNCEKTKLGDVTKKYFHKFPSFVFSQFVQKCNKNVLPKNVVTTPPLPTSRRVTYEVCEHTFIFYSNLLPFTRL